MIRRLLSLLILLPRLAQCQFCEDFNSYSKGQLAAIGWNAVPDNGFAINKSGAYSGKSAFISAGIGNVMYLVTPCFTSNSSTETLTFQHTFNTGSGTFCVGIQDGFAATATGVIWLDTMGVINAWTPFSMTFTLPFSNFRIVYFLGNT